MDHIHYTKPSIGNIEISLALDAVQNGWGKNCYDYINKFEEAFKQHLGIQFAISTSSCTGALQMGLSAMGIGKDDEVILADTNWIATVSPIVHLGATPIFVDIDPENWCIDPKNVEKAITPKCRAIIATHLYGNLCDMDKLLDIGNRYNLPVIEDAAEAIGSIWKGRKAGSIGKFGVFSFHGSKTITTGEGGMFVTSDPTLYETVLDLSNHGRNNREVRQFWPNKIGYKFKMSNIQAAIGLGQLTRIDELIAQKRKILSYYREQLSEIKQINLNPEPPNGVNGAWMPTAVFESNFGVNRSMLNHAFHNANIDARPFFYPLSSLPMFNDCQNNYHSWSIPDRSINLPSYHEMSLKDIDRVCDILFQICQRK